MFGSRRWFIAKIENRNRRFGCQVEVALGYSDIGNRGSAERIIDAQAEEVDDRDDPATRASWSNQLSIAYFKLDRRDRAERLFTRALSAADQITSQDDRIFHLNFISSLQARAGNAPAAHIAFERVNPKEDSDFEFLALMLAQSGLIVEAAEALRQIKDPEDRARAQILQAESLTKKRRHSFIC